MPTKELGTCVSFRPQYAQPHIHHSKYQPLQVAVLPTGQCKGPDGRFQGGTATNTWVLYKKVLYY